MPAVLSAKNVETLVPASQDGLDKPRTYFIRTPTKQLKALFNRELAARGVRAHSEAAMIEAARIRLEAAEVSNKQMLLDLCDRVAAVVAARMAHNDPDTPPPELSADDQEIWSGFLDALTVNDPSFGRLVAENRYFSAMSPLICAAVFLNGWQNVGIPFSRGFDNLVDPALIEQLDDLDLFEIWMRVVALFQPSGTDVKNSASPSLSSASPADSVPAGSTSSSLQTEATGSSSVNGTPVTLN